MSKYKEERSFVFIMAIVIVSVLIIAVWEYTFVVSQNLRIAVNMVKEVQAIAIARAAYRGSLAVLKRDRTDVDGPHDEWRLLMPPILPLGRGTARIEIEAEDGKLNVNHLIQRFEDESLNDSYIHLQALLEILGYEQNAADGIVDFIDENSISMGHGAEKDYYEELKPPIIIKNGPLDSIREILSIKGLSLKMYYGDAEKNEKEEVRQPMLGQEVEDDDEDEKVKIWSPNGLRYYLTVYGDLYNPTKAKSTESNYVPININYMPLRLLQAMNEELDDFNLEEIEKFRKKFNFTNKEIEMDYMISNFGFTKEVWEYFFGANGTKKKLKVNSNYFRIRGVGEVDNITRIVDTVIQRDGKYFKVLYYTEI